MHDLINLSERLESGLVRKLGPTLGISRAKLGASAKRSGFVVQRRTVLLVAVLLIGVALLGGVGVLWSNFEVTLVRKRGEASGRVHRAAVAMQATRWESELVGHLAHESKEGHTFRTFQRRIREAEAQLTANITQILRAAPPRGGGNTNHSVTQRLLAAINATYAHVDSIFRPIVATMTNESSDAAARLHALHKQLSASLDDSMRLELAASARVGGGGGSASVAATGGGELSAEDRAALAGAEAPLRAIVANFMNESAAFAADAPRVVLAASAISRIAAALDELQRDEIDAAAAKLRVDAEAITGFAWKDWATNSVALASLEGYEQYVCSFVCVCFNESIVFVFCFSSL